MKDSFRMMNLMESECSHGPMAQATMAGGEMAKNTDKASIKVSMETL